MDEWWGRLKRFGVFLLVIGNGLFFWFVIVRDETMDIRIIFSLFFSVIGTFIEFLLIMGAIGFVKWIWNGTENIE